MAQPPASDVTKTGSGRATRRRRIIPRIHPHLRRSLSAYKWLFGFVVVGVIFAAPVAVLIQHGTKNFWPNVINQIAALWSLILAYPLPAALVTLALFALLALSVRADAESAAATQSANAQIAATAGGAAGAVSGASAGATAATGAVRQQLPALAHDVGTQVGHAVAGAMAPPLQGAAAAGGFVGGFDGGYRGATIAVIDQAPVIADAVTDRLHAELQEDLAIAVAAGQRAQLDAPPLPAGVVTTTGLPRARKLFGRAPQLNALLAALTAGGAINVCAVEGLPGIGKTALAAEAVAQAVARGDFPTAVWLSCEGRHGAAGLADIWTSAATLLGEPTIAQLPDATRQRAALHATLANPARDRLLLALDNVEPDLPDGYADTLAQTLTGPQVALLLTARQALTSPLVRAFPLDVLEGAAAQAFFRALLQLRFPDRPTPDEAAVLPDLIVELGGLALAIQLTADYASVQRRPLPVLLQQIRQQGVATGPLAKLTASIDRSWAILSPTQCLLFAGLSLLDGSSFPRAAALAVATQAVATQAVQAAHIVDDPTEQADGAGAPTETSGDALDALVGLSLVEALTDDRMRLHPLIREYAANQLEKTPADAQQALGAAAFTYWLTYAQAHPDYAGMDALEAEAEGLMAALRWTHDHQRYADTLSLAHALNTYWFIRGRVAEAREARPWAVAAAEATGNVPEQRWAYHELAVVAADTGDVVGARQGYETALRLATALGDKASQSLEWQSLGSLDMKAGDHEKAREELIAALQLARQVEQPARIVEAVWWLAELDRLAGNASSACAGFREALQLYERLNHPDAEITRQRLQALGCG